MYAQIKTHASIKAYVTLKPLASSYRYGSIEVWQRHYGWILWTLHLRPRREIQLFHNGSHLFWVISTSYALIITPCIRFLLFAIRYHFAFVYQGHYFQYRTVHT